MANVQNWSVLRIARTARQIQQMTHGHRLVANLYGHYATARNTTLFANTAVQTDIMVADVIIHIVQPSHVQSVRQKQEVLSANIQPMVWLTQL